MNVLSLFDGMSCGQIALDKFNIKYDNYFASEIDKYAIRVTQHNYPDTIQLGDINGWKNWDLPEIDLILAGSPCQGFSIAGKGLNFDDPRSKLYFVFEEILYYYNPKYWLLENVNMRQDWQDIISQRLGINPIMINSALVSAQNRKRLYWTNIYNQPDLFGNPCCVIPQPEDKKIYLKDIIEDGFVDRQKSFCLDSSYFKAGNLRRYIKSRSRQLIFDYPISVAMRGDRKYKKKQYDNSRQHFEVGNSHKTNAITSVEKDNYLMYSDLSYRKLTPLECERLQTVPDNYTLILDDNGKQLVSNTQRYKMLGNGWTIDVVTHILSFISPSPIHSQPAPLPKKR